MKPWKLLIIINNRNGAKFLAQTICSVKWQTVFESNVPGVERRRNIKETKIRKKPPRKYEIYVLGIDAGSEDESREIYEHYADWTPLSYDGKTVKIGKESIRDFKFEEGLTPIFMPAWNQSKAINEAIRLARDKIDGLSYFAWINSDDMYLPNFVEKHIDDFKRDKRLMMTYTKVLTFQEVDMINVKGERIKQRCFPHGGDLVEGLKKRQNLVLQPSVMLSMKVFDKIGYCNEKFNYAFDFDMWIKIVKNGLQYRFDPDSFTALYRLRKDNLTHTKHQEIKSETEEVLRVNKL